MAETHEDITLNEGSETDSDWVSPYAISRRLDHLDEITHELLQAVYRIEKMTGAMHEELEAARPLIEKWTHSKLVKLAAGQFPWAQNATGGNHDHPA